MKNEKYAINMHTFNGADERGYSYTIWFNKSLDNTVRMKGLVKGMDEAEQKEAREDALQGAKDFLRWINPFKTIVRLFKKH